MDIEIRTTRTEKVLNVWTTATATINGRKFKIEMVRFDNPSRYGIRRGRISKLWAKAPDRSVVISYDRGWAHLPIDLEGKALLEEILKKYN